MHELVSGGIYLPWNRDLQAAYNVRDQLAAEALAAGLDLKRARYGVRAEKIAD